MSTYAPPVCPICERAVKYLGSSVRVRREVDGALLVAHASCARWRKGFEIVTDDQRAPGAA